MLTFCPDYIEHATLSLVQTRTKTRSPYICSVNYGNDDIFCFILSDLWIGSLIIHGTLLNEDKKSQKENQIHVYTLARKLVFSSLCYTWPGEVKTNTLKTVKAALIIRLGRDKHFNYESIMNDCKVRRVRICHVIQTVILWILYNIDIN